MDGIVASLITAFLLLQGCYHFQARHLSPEHLEGIYEELKLYREITYGERQA